jgi:TolA-binding protein
MSPAELAALSQPPTRPAAAKASSAAASGSDAGDGSNRQGARATPDAGPAVATAPPAPSGELQGARALIAAGKQKEALAQLLRLQKEAPEGPSSAEVHLLLSNLYCERSWFTDCLAAYKVALARSPRYREHPELLGHLVDALTSHRFHAQAGKFLVKDVGKPALPALRRAALEHKDADVRARAARLLGELR